ncbi:MAG: carbamoyltransferase HypF [Anaerohalosphaeraceae bacterium]|nr:carbamoyltransferase HypF [Anaerohalosphaeraceae bacterium]
MIIRKQIAVTGQVQGIGFRPYIYRLAQQLGLTGAVRNDTAGVSIEVQGRTETIAEFIATLNSENPQVPLMKILSIEASDVEVIKSESDFSIIASNATGDISAGVTADAATCGECIAELFDPTDFRFSYAFVNCTNCGPRYSIIKAVPYDRPQTTMAEFAMCKKCGGQYANINDRRFHAQPIACEICGPAISLADSTGKTIENDQRKVIQKTVEILLNGKIVAIKGLGGFHLVCDGQNDSAVKMLRLRKRRDSKPLAMMASSIETIKKFAEVSDLAEKILASPQSPIVLLPKRKNAVLSPAVAGGVNTFGFMLASTPLHHLLLAEEVDGRKLNAIVATSGNVSDEPLICKNDIAISQLGSIADAFLTHNREIYRQVDDSVVHIIDDKPVMLRRARGFVPTAITAKAKIENEIFACGADLKNTFCFAKNNQFILSEHIGDLAEGRVYRHWLKSIEHFRQLFDAHAEIVVCDLHPGYLSSSYARKIEGVKLIEVQHHWAHAASVMAENGITNERTIALIADGTGFGTDGAIWGCECLIASLQNFSRFGHLDYFPLPGGDAASKQALRPVFGLALKYDLMLSDKLLSSIEPDENKIKIIRTQLEKNINTVQTSSLGRVFDAVAALCGLGSENNFEAQLPMTLEAIADETIKDCYPYQLQKNADPVTVNIAGLLSSIINDRQKGVGAAVISAKFHNTVAGFMCDLAVAARKETAINTVVLSGGVFCNRFLANRLIKLLRKNDFRVLFNTLVPSNDGGISLGQAAIASTMTEK